MPPSRPSDEVDRVKTFIQHSKASSSMAIPVDEARVYKISPRDWFELRDELCHYQGESFHRYTYDASKSILTIKGPPSEVHQVVIEFVYQELCRSISRSTSIRIASASNIGYSEGRYEGSDKAPDQAIHQQNSKGKWEVKWALEVGFAEEYKKLKSDVILMLEIDAERSSWQDEIETEKRKRQRVEKSLERVKKQSESKISASQREVDLLKGDFCDFEDELRGTHHDLRQAQSSLLLQSKSLTEKEHEISRLLNAIETLKGGHEREQQQLRNELTIAQSDTDLAQSTLATISDDYEGVRRSWT